MKIIPTAENLLILPSFTPDGHLRAVIEIPAGTNTKYEYDKKSLVFRPDLRNGQPRIIDFLPYPVNYGFVPNTVMEKKRGGDGDPLDVIVICESVPTGTILEVLPIGLILLQDGGEWDNKVLAVPADPARRTVQARNFKEFQSKYSAARHAIEQFFMYYDGLGVMTVMGWKNEKAAVREIEKWQIR